MPECKDCKQDCFAYLSGKCRVLNNTDFNGKQCPFYKTKAQWLEELKKWPMEIF